MSSLAFLLMVLNISAYSIRGLSSPFSTISRRFVIRAHVGEDILDLRGLLIVLATLGAHCWTMYVMVSRMVSMSSSSCFGRIGFQIRVIIRSSSILFVWYLLLVVSWSSIVFLSISTPIAIL